MKINVGDTVNVLDWERDGLYRWQAPTEVEVVELEGPYVTVKFANGKVATYHYIDLILPETREWWRVESPQLENGYAIVTAPSSVEAANKVTRFYVNEWNKVTKITSPNEIKRYDFVYDMKDELLAESLNVHLEKST